MSVVQFDFFDMTGLGCGIDINHANRLVIAALSPIVLLSCAAASSFVAKKSLRKKLKVAGNENKLLPLWIAALSSTFDLIDVDASGELDVDDLSRILDVVHTRHSTSPSNIDPTRNLPKTALDGARCIFATYQDPADSLGETDFHSGHFHILDFF